MRALVTGSAGFVGRHMAAELGARGWQVDGWDIVDGRDALDLFREHDSAFYDLVVHAAASSPHRIAIDTQPVHMARNLQLDAAMFDWAVRTSQRRVLYLSSSAAYPVGLQTGYGSHRLRETDGDPERPISAALLETASRVGPFWPDAAYGWTKLTGERLAQAARACGAQVTVVRPFSGYGEDQSTDFPFRALLERARGREDPFPIWGSGGQVRDWIHIDDVVAGALAVAESGSAVPVNLCTGVGTSMLDLAQMACAAVGYRPEFRPRAEMPAGVAYRVGDPSVFLRYYQPAVSLTDGVRRALEVPVCR